MNLPLPVAMGIWILIGLLILALIVRGLIRRRADGADTVTTLDQIPNEAIGAALCAPLEAVYVSTTRHGDWLARIGVFGLGNRSDVTIAVFDSGIALRRVGEIDFFIPADRIQSTSTSSGIAGKYIPRDGLDVISWLPPHGDALVDTGLRIADKSARESFQQALTIVTSSSTMTLEENS